MSTGKPTKEEWANQIACSGVFVLTWAIMTGQNWLLHPAWYQVVGAALTGTGLYLGLRKPSDKDAKELEHIFLARGVTVKVGEEQEPPQLIEVKHLGYGKELVYNFPWGKGLKECLSCKDAIQDSQDVEIEMYAENCKLHVVLYNQKLSKKIPYEVPDLSEYKLGILIGMSRMGPLIIDLAGGNGSPHCLNGGESGWGKSTWIRGVVCSLLLNYPREYLDITWIDLKQVEAGLFEDCDRINCIFDRDDALLYLNKLTREMEKRLRTLRKHKCLNIAEYNEIAEPWPYKLVLVEEFGSLDDEDIHKATIELGQKARACGIHLILSCQRPDTKAIPGNLKNNLGVRLSFHSADELNSRIILGESHSEASQLQYPGRGICISDHVREVQAYLITKEQTLEILDSLKTPVSSSVSLDHQ